MSSDRPVALAIHRAWFLKPLEKLQMLNVVADEQSFRSLSLSDVEIAVGRTLRTRQWDPTRLYAQAELDARLLRSRGIQVAWLDDPAYPALLREIYDPPFALFHRGEFPPDWSAAVAVVGTRRPTGRALERAYELGADLARAGAVVVSGLARGIDAAAHRGAVDRGGVSVAVLGNGIDAVFPRSSLPVARELLARGGCIAGEYPPGVPPAPYHFPARNRIISGLCPVTVVVQAPARSGALITADFALEQGRDLCVHADGVHGPAGVGTAALVEDGAPSIRSAADLLTAEPGRAAPSPRTPRTPVEAGKILARQLEMDLTAGHHDE
jgi:DNA processing protein